MSDVKYIRINSYDLIDENDNLIAENLQMDEQAVVEDNGVDVAFALQAGPPILKPRRTRI